MGGMNILFPFTVCQDLVKNQDDQQCHVYKASVSVGETDGTKTTGSLRARVVSTNSPQADKMVEIDVSFPCLLAKYLTEREKLNFHIEGLQKILQNEERTINCSEDLEHPRSHEADDSHIPKQTEQAFDQKSLGKESTNRPSHNGEKPLLSREVGNFHQSPDEVQKEENQNTAVSAESEADQVSLAANINNSDHGYSLTVCESQYRDQTPTTFNLPKQTMKNPKRSTNKYDELIRKLKQPIDAPKVADSLLAHSSLSTQNMPPTNTSSACGLSADMQWSLSGTRSETPQALNMDGTNQKGGTGDDTKEDCTTDEAVPLGSSVSVQRRFVRKYDRLIKSLEMASERSGLEMLSVLSGHSYKLDHDAKREQKRSDSVTVDMSVKERSACDSGAKLAAKGDDSGSSLEPIKDKNISEKMKGSISSSNKPPSRQNLSHMTSFPRKFPSSLTRTDVLNVFVSNTKAGQSRKRRLASTGMIEGISLNKHKKADDDGKLRTTSADSEIERTHAEFSKELPKNDSTVSGQNVKTSTLHETDEATGVTASTCVNSLLSKPASTVAPAARDLKAQSQSPRGLSDVFYLPLGPSGNGQSNSKAQENMLVGPFQLLGDVAPKARVPMTVSNDDKLFSRMPGHPLSSGSLSSSKRKKALKGEPPMLDHDYTNLVYDKNAPSSRALKTLVKPISMSQHINARVERVEEGEGSSLVTISGLNRKAAGGSHPYTMRPVLGVNKEGMCIAETLEDALTDTIRCREKLQDSYRTAIQAKSCQPVQVDASDVPVAREVVITPARCHPDILHHSFKPCTFMPRTKRKPPTLHHHAKIDDSDAQDAILFMQGDAGNGKETVTNTLFCTNEMKTERVEETDSFFQEQSNPVLMGTRLQTGEQILVINSSHSEPDLDSIIHTNNETVKQDTSSDCNEEITIKHTYEKKPPEQHVVIDNEKEAARSQHHLSTNVCRYCLKIFHSPTMLYKHVITVHTAYSVSPQVTHYLQTLKRDSQVVCPLCPNLYILCNEYHLRAHLVSCHGRTKADLVDSSAGVPASVVCEVCQMHFLMVRELETHARLMHSCDVVSCPHCPLVFVMEDTRAKHMAMVHGDNSGCPFVCRLCGAAFESKEDLRFHKQVHGRRSRPQDSVKTRITTPPCRTKWRTRGPRRCQHCPSMEFPDLTHLFRHNQQVHVGPVPVHCLFCGLGFRNMRAMSVHLRTHLSPPCTSRGRPTSLHCPFCDQKAYLSIPFQLVSHMLKKHQDRFPYSCGLCSQSFASEKPLHIHLKQAHRREVAGVSGAPSVLDPVTEGNSDSDRNRESYPESSVSVVSTSQGEAGKADAVSVLRCLPEEAQTLIQKITQQGKQAVVTISLQKRGEQKIVFTPSPSHSTSEVLKPASQPISMLASSKRLPRTEHFQSVGDSQKGKSVSDELSSSEDPFAGLYVSSLGGATTGVEERTSTDTYVVIHDSSMDTGFTDTNYEHVQDADQTDAKSITMINSGDISVVSSGTQNAAITVDGCGEYFSEQASHIEEEATGEMRVLVAEEVFVIENVE